MMKIYVGNLSHDITEPQLRESFEKFGEVSSLDIVKDKDSGKPRGFAFVEMFSEENAKNAISGLNETEMDGRQLKVSRAQTK
jgi:RNA recognition motif-containing protein